MRKALEKEDWSFLSRPALDSDTMQVTFLEQRAHKTSQLERSRTSALDYVFQLGHYISEDVIRLQTPSDSVFTSAQQGDFHVAHAEADSATSNGLLAAVSTQTKCPSRLSGISDGAVQDAFQRKKQSSGGPSKQTRSNAEMITKLSEQKLFIVACLHQSEHVLPHWSAELTRFLLALRNTNDSGTLDNVFVSVYESGSTDLTKKYLEELMQHFDFLGVPHEVVLGDMVRGERNRIDFMADVRNQAMLPLHRSGKEFDRVFWLSDNFFCADGLLQMLVTALPGSEGGVGADAVCGMDFAENCVFYDRWATTDMTGKNLYNQYPYFASGENLTAGGSASPFQMYTCWNAMVVFTADIFQKQRLKFRRSVNSVNECALAETELIFRDMWEIGHGKVVLDPRGVASYTAAAFSDLVRKCHRVRQQEEFVFGNHVEFSPAPKQAPCCPLLNDHDTFVDLEACFMESTKDRPRPSTIPKLETDQITKKQDAIETMGDPSYGAKFRKLWPLPVSILPFMICAYISPYLITGSIANAFWFAVAIWSGSSLAMNMINKVAVGILPLPLTLLVLQMLIADILLLIIVGPWQLLSEIREKLANVWRWSLLVVPFSGMLLTSMIALHEGSVITLVVVRGALPLVTLFLERIALPENSKSIDAMQCGSLFLILCGTFVYACADLHNSGSWKALACICINMVCTVAHRILERQLLVDTSMRLSFGAASMVNNSVGIIPIACFMLLLGEHHRWAESFASREFLQLKALACIIFSGVVGLCLGFYSIVIQKHVSATAHLVLQTAVKFLTVIAIIFLLHEQLSLIKGVGCFVTLLGGAWYGVASQSGVTKC